MDPVTHTLVGVNLARTRLGRTTALAPAALAIGANLPDIDALSLFAGGDIGLGFRRGWTHGPLALVVLPPLLAMVLLAWNRRGAARGKRRARPGPLLALCYLAALTHPALDWLNTYGIRLLMPFSERWFYGDAVFIVDPWVWLVLGGAAALSAPPGRGWRTWVVLGLLGTVLMAVGPVPTPARLAWLAGLSAVVTAAVAARRAGRVSPRAAIAGILVVAVYVTGLVAATRLARERVLPLLAQEGVTGVERLMVGPLPANPLSWDVVAATPGAYHVGTFRWAGEPRLEVTHRFPTPPATAVVEAAMSAPDIQGTLGWMRFPFVEVETTETGYTVYILDARYVRERTEGFGGVVVHLDEDLSVVVPGTAPR